MEKEKRLIDANKLITDIQGTASEVAKTAPYSAEWFTRLHDRQCEIIEIIKGQAAVDAVEVVRCKDCWNCTKSMWCNLLMMDTRKDNFCSYGERRTNV